MRHINPDQSTIDDIVSKAEARARGQKRKRSQFQSVLSILHRSGGFIKEPDGRLIPVTTKWLLPRLRAIFFTPTKVDRAFARDTQLTYAGDVRISRKQIDFANRLIENHPEIDFSRPMFYER